LSIGFASSGRGAGSMNRSVRGWLCFSRLGGLNNHQLKAGGFD
jgi:hypothetical protein